MISSFVAKKKVTTFKFLLKTGRSSATFSGLRHFKKKKKMNVLQTLEHIFTFLLLLANRFPFVAVSIAFAVNKEVSEQKTQNKTTVEPFTKQLENASVPPW